MSEPTYPISEAIATCCGADPGDVSRELLRGIQAAMQRYGIDSRLQQAHFLAQIGHESGGLQYTEEVWGPTEAQERYEPPSDLATTLGNEFRGDGKRFKGRGLIQLTGRSNYERYNSAVPVDVVDRPELVAGPDLAADVAGWYWSTHELSEIAAKGNGGPQVDERTLRVVTREINGGHNGIDDRRERLQDAKTRLFRGQVEEVPAAGVEPIVTTDPTDDAHLA